jgi:flap endonuclease-1
MGVAIGDLLYKEEIEISSLKNKLLGVDGHNITYQFLTTIRDVNGDYLTNSKGRVTSHIIGLFYRLSKILEDNIDLVFVFDGKPLELKKDTIAKRKDIKIEAEKNADAKRLAGDIKGSAAMMRRTAKITSEMIEDAKELLDCFNIQHFDALHDGEAQLTVLNNEKKIDGIVSQDYDVLLLGGQDLYRNLTISGKKKVSGKDYFVQVKPEYINLQQNLAKLNLTREKLIWLGILVGTDFNEKVPKVGPKTAIKLVQEYNSLEQIFNKLNYTPEFDYKEVFDIFEFPKAKNLEINKPKRPDFEKLKDLLISKYEFNEERVNNTLNSLEKTLIEKKAQKTLWG